MTDVRTARTGSVGWITLDRPKAINALTHEMVRTIAATLEEWATDDAVGMVVLTGAGERGLCAGGDIVAIHDDATAGGDATAAFWRDEYRLNAMINRYPKPYLAVMDGLVMGGGVGVSGHASHRLVTERTRIAMPETGIGFVPDVGGTWLLARASGRLGTHAALTGAQLGAGDAVAMGLADWFVPTDHLAGLLCALGDVVTTGPDLEEQLGGLLDQMGEPAPEPGLGSSRWWIDRCYAQPTVEAVVAALSASGVQDAEDTAKTIGERSPSCVKVAFESLRRARRADCLEQVLDTEFRVSLRCLAAPDMVEGIRAQVVDKDRAPRWDPPVLERVDDDRVAGYFAPLDGTPELGLEDAR